MDGGGLCRGEEAQTFRWDCFERTLSDSYLRAYLKRLPDFDDIEAEERAMAHATAYPSLLHALQFFLDWPALDRGAELLVARHDEIDGDHYEYLAPAAEALTSAGRSACLAQSHAASRREQAFAAVRSACGAPDTPARRGARSGAGRATHPGNHAAVPGRSCSAHAP